MAVQEFTDYLSRLLGHPVASDGFLTLSSGQQARVAGWLSERGFTLARLRSRLSTPFTPAGLLDGGEANTTAPLMPAGVASAPVPGGPATRVGIDIQRIDELIPESFLADPKSSTELTAIFTMREISYAQTRPHLEETLGGLFAAKEALRKCDPALMARALTEIEVLPDAAGRPGFADFALSISHSGGFAIAVAVAPAAGDAARDPAPSAPIATAVREHGDSPRQDVPPRSSRRLAFSLLLLTGILLAMGLALHRAGVLCSCR